MYDVGSIRDTEMVRRWVRMHSDQDAGAAPLISAVPRAFCQNHCIAWNTRKGKRGEDYSYCGKTIIDQTRRCGWSWERIRRKMSGRVPTLE